MSRLQDIGGRFEADFADEMGLERVPGSGSQWHSKLDVKGRGVLWSLKATTAARISGKDFEEAIHATFGPGGDGRMGLMALRFFAETDDELDLVLMRKDDFFSIASGKYELVQQDKTAARRERAATPELLRDLEEEG
jgi:hypothetical protein